MTLSREVEQGLTLAIHLDISDSAITGMGFDSLARGMNIFDITYRILLLWKRRTASARDGQVELLCSGLEQMGRQDAAEIIRQRHRQNAELTPECFTSFNESTSTSENITTNAHQNSEL